MTWEIVFLGALILVLGASAIIMASRSKNSGTTVVQGGVDINKLAKEVATEVGKEMAKAVASELRDILYSIPQGGRGYSGGSNRTRDIPEIEMDESIIPIKLDAGKMESNLEGMAKEEVKVDKDLDKSKSKLQALLGKKKKKE